VWVNTDPRSHSLPKQPGPKPSTLGSSTHTDEKPKNGSEYKNPRHSNPPQGLCLTSATTRTPFLHYTTNSRGERDTARTLEKMRKKKAERPTTSISGHYTVNRTPTCRPRSEENTSHETKKEGNTKGRTGKQPPPPNPCRKKGVLRRTRRTPPPPSPEAGTSFYKGGGMTKPPSQPKKKNGSKRSSLHASRKE